MGFSTLKEAYFESLGGENALKGEDFVHAMDEDISEVAKEDKGYDSCTCTRYRGGPLGPESGGSRKHVE